MSPLVDTQSCTHTHTCSPTWAGTQIKTKKIQLHTNALHSHTARSLCRRLLSLYLSMQIVCMITCSINTPSLIAAHQEHTSNMQQSIQRRPQFPLAISSIHRNPHVSHYCLFSFFVSALVFCCYVRAGVFLSYLLNLNLKCSHATHRRWS